MHGHNQFNWIIWIADGEGEVFGFSFVKSNLSIVFAISKRKLSSPLEFESLFKKKKEKEKVSNDLIVRAKTDDLKKKKKISRDYRASDDKNYINVCQLIELT